MKKSKSNSILLILPILIGILAYTYHYYSGAFFATFPDSTYIYLINGTNIAAGNFEIGHFDNPGTPAHWLVGIIIFIAHLFIGNNTVAQDVFTNPELYLNICCVVIVSLLQFSTYTAGHLVYKKTKNVLKALFFQLVPISSYSVVHHFVRIIPESIIIISVTFYIAYLWTKCLDIDENKNTNLFNLKTIITISFFSALLITTKITCLPFLFLPLFIIKGIKQKISYTIFTIAIALLILFPVWPRFKEMYYWYTGLATHAGHYGSGAEETINIKTLTENLIKLLTHEYFFTIGFICLLLLIIVGFIKKSWKNIFFKLILGIFFTICVQLVLAAKHYGYHYIIASQMLIIPGIIAGFQLFELKLLSQTKKISWILFLICTCWLLTETYQSATIQKNGNFVYETMKEVKKYNHLPRIITTGYEESPFRESALHFGSFYGGGFYHESNYMLRKLYPKSYFYLILENAVKKWEQPVASADIFENNPEVLIYFQRTDDATLLNTLKTITKDCQGLIKGIKLVYYNPATAERLCILSIDTLKANHQYREKEAIFCDMENITNDKLNFISKDGNHFFSGVELITSEKKFSGNNVIKATNDQYPCYSTLNVHPGDKLTIQVKYLAKGRPGGITISASKFEVFNRSSECIEKELSNGWKSLKLTTTIPNDYTEKDIRLNLFYWGKEICYFDDLEITHYKK